MSQFKINSITDKTGYCGPVIAGVSTNNSTGCMIIPVGPTEHRGGRGRGIVAGGRNNPSPAVAELTIDMHEIATTGNAVDFGDLATGNTGVNGGNSSTTRAVLAGGYEDPALTSRLQFVIMSSSGGAVNFGNLVNGVNGGIGCGSNNIRGIFYGGNNPEYVPFLSHINLQSLGTDSDFGSTLVAQRNAACAQSGTRAVFAGGDASTGNLFTIQSIEFATLGTPTSFGQLTDDRTGHTAVSSGTRGVFAGGKAPGVVDTMEYITIATEGNGTDFGDLSAAKRNMAGNSNSIRGTFAGGHPAASGSGSNINVIEYITIASTGNAADFGDLTEARRCANAGGSDAHGGLVR